MTGGIGAGKSAALEAFSRHGAATISSDEIVHRLLREEDDVKAALVRRFGEGILDEAGQIDRSAVAQIVFSDRAELEWLEGLLHPLVSAQYMRWRAALSDLDDPPAVAATEVPLLYESGAEGRFDAVVVITAPLGLRRARRQAPSDPREVRLIPDREKAKRADYVYVNDRGFEELDAFVARVVTELSRKASM